MSIYKYVGPGPLEQYLENWHLRLTPPAAFNDPFDVNPVIPVDTWASSLDTAQKSAIRKTMKRRFQDGDMGVLCLTRTRMHPLMWAHYAEGHQGALLEFDNDHPCFNRRPEPDSVQGHLMSVLYADERPSLGNVSLGHLAALHTTKGLDWAYEQELRLLWSLRRADRNTGREDRLGYPIVLYAVPVEALKRVVLGCRIKPDVAAKTQQALGCSAAKHVRLELAKPSSQDYRLHYVSASPGLSWTSDEIEWE